MAAKSPYERPTGATVISCKISMKFSSGVVSALLKSGRHWSPSLEDPVYYARAHTTGEEKVTMSLATK
eukprot:scaffold167874_cov68-Attheya_sp.AAC.1